MAGHHGGSQETEEGAWQERRPEIQGQDPRSPPPPRSLLLQELTRVLRNPGQWEKPLDLVTSIRPRLLKDPPPLNTAVLASTLPA